MAPLFCAQVQPLTQVLVQFDAIDMVFVKQVFLPAVGLVMMLSAQSNRRQPYMDDLFTVTAHADPVHMMDFRRFIADGAAPVGQTEVQILADVIGLVEQTVFGRHGPVKAELYQVIDEALGRGHVSV